MESPSSLVVYLWCTIQRYTFSCSLLFASISLLGLAYSNILLSLSILWSIHGLFQGVGGPALTRYVCDNYTNTKTIVSTDTVWSILICGGNLGYLFGPFILLPLINNDQWQHCFRVLGVVGVVMSLAIYLFIYNTTNCTNTKRNLTNNNSITNNNTRFIAILKTSQFWLTTLSSSLTYLALKTMADWTFLYLVEHAGSSTQVATELMVYNEVGGIAGTFLCGVLSIYIGRY
jgi:sugar phosphate permease